MAGVVLPQLGQQYSRPEMSAAILFIHFLAR